MGGEGTRVATLTRHSCSGEGRKAGNLVTGPGVLFLQSVACKKKKVFHASAIVAFVGGKLTLPH